MGYGIRFEMRTRGLFSLILCMLSVSSLAQVPFHRGVNLTQWFQASSARQIQFTKFTRKDFENIKSLGCDVIRLPVNLHEMTSGAPDYTLDPLLINFLDQAVDWSEALNIYLILDNHSFDPAIDTQPAVENILVKVWSQLANHYKDRSDYLLYEILNEPHGISDAAWGAIQQSVINAIRVEDQNHQIIVGGSSYNSYTTLGNLPVYTDDKLIYTFHFYDPFLFTHQGASWVGPSLVPLANIPFPYRSSGMPQLPSVFNGTWIQSAYNNYPGDGTVTKVKQLLDVAVNFKNNRNVPVFCGEFGVFIPNSNATDRVEWYREVKNYLAEKNIPWTMWDYTGGFGLFEPNSSELFEYDLNVPLLEAVDFTVPPQKNFSNNPETKGFIIYDDFVGERIIASNSAVSGTLDYYNTDMPHVGDYSIHWGDAAQYESIGFDFTPNRNLSFMPAHDFELSFWVRGNSPGASFDVRFVDTKTGNTDHPWRMGKTIDETIAAWDGEWHQVVIPLNTMEEKGSWDNAWFNPEGKFDWSSAGRFEVVAEHQALTDIEFSFDDIEVRGEEFTIIVGVETQAKDSDVMIYPNPVSAQATIEFAVSNPETTVISIFNQHGQQIRTLFHNELTAGTSTVIWNLDNNQGNQVTSGLYMVRIYSKTTTRQVKLLVLN